MNINQLEEIEITDIKINISLTMSYNLESMPNIDISIVNKDKIKINLVQYHYESPVKDEPKQAGLCKLF